MEFNKSKAIELANTIMPLFQGSKKPFDVKSCDSILPDRIKPKSLEHRLFLFLTAPGNFSVDSEIYYNNARQMFNEEPNYFNPEYIKDNFTRKANKLSKLIKIIDEEEKTVSGKLAEIIKNSLGGRKKELARRLWANSVELEKYNFDPINIFSKDDTIESALKKLDGYRDKKTRIQHGFRGFKQKIGNMLINQYLETGILELKDPENANIPTDYHVINLSIARGILMDVGEIRREKVADFLDKNYKEFFRENKHINSLEFSRALWMLGKYVCSYAGCNDSCPLEIKCEKSINSSEYFEKAMIIVENR